MDKTRVRRYGQRSLPLRASCSIQIIGTVIHRDAFQKKNPHWGGPVTLKHTELFGWLFALFLLKKVLVCSKAWIRLGQFSHLTTIHRLPQGNWRKNGMHTASPSHTSMLVAFLSCSKQNKQRSMATQLDPDRIYYHITSRKVWRCGKFRFIRPSLQPSLH